MTVNPVRVGVVGATWYAETHMARIVTHPHATLNAIVGLDENVLSELATKYQVPHTFTTFDELLNSGVIDAIVIIAPDEFHSPMARAAFEAGIHVLCEKPLSTSSSEAEKMYRAATSSGLQHMSYFALRNSAHHRYLKELIDEGYLGRVYSAEFSLTHGFFRHNGYQWRFDATRGTGALGDLGCYVIDLARWYIGEITAVTAATAHHINRPHPEGQDYPAANDSAAATLEFDNGALATMFVSVTSHQAQRVQTNTISLRGDGGTLELQHTFNGSILRGARDGDETFTELELPEHLSEDPNAYSQLAPSVGDHAFIEAILHGTPLVPSFYDGWRVQQVLEAAATSAETGTRVTVEQATA